MAKTGRNDLCHCGSGRKYKKCHGNKETPAARGRMMERGESFGIAHVHVDAQFLDEVLGRRHPAVRHVPVLLRDA